MFIVTSLVGSVFALLLGAIFVYGIAYAFALGHDAQSAAQIAIGVLSVMAVVGFWTRRPRLAVGLVAASTVVFALCMWLS